MPSLGRLNCMCFSSLSCAASFSGSINFPSSRSLPSSFSKVDLILRSLIGSLKSSAKMIDGMGDKAAAKETMKNAGVPTIPGSDGLIKDFNECKKLA